MDKTISLIKEQAELKEKLNKLLNNDSEFKNLSAEAKLQLCTETYNRIEKLSNLISEEICQSNDLEMIQEINIRRLDRQTQRELRKIFIAISLAKKANDVLYTKYKRGVEMRKRNKALILQKYGTKALQIAMQEQNAKKV